MGRAVRQFEKEASLRLETGVEYVAWDEPSASWKKKLVLDQQQEKYSLTDTLKKLVIASPFKKWPQPYLLSLAPKIKASCPLKINLGFGLKPVQN